MFGMPLDTSVGISRVRYHKATHPGMYPIMLNDHYNSFEDRQVLEKLQILFRLPIYN